MNLLRFTKKQPLWIAAALAVFLLVRSLFAYSAVDPVAVDILRRWVISEAETYQLGRTDLGLGEKASLLQSAATIEFSSVKVRGSAGNMVFRVELGENPALPPGMSRVRYFRMRYRMALGWEVMPRQGSALGYFLALFLL